MEMKGVNLRSQSRSIARGEKRMQLENFSRTAVTKPVQILGVAAAVTSRFSCVVLFSWSKGPCVIYVGQKGLADIKEPKNVYIEAGIVGLTRTSVYINQVDIMGLLATGKISFSVMTFYTKCLYSMLKSSGRNDRYGFMCPLTIQTHGNIDMGLIRNMIGEGGFECFLLPFYDKGWELMTLCPNIGCITLFSCTGKSKKTKKKFPEMIETAFEAYHLVKGLRSNTLSKPKWIFPKCCNDDDVDADCGLFVMRHMFEIRKLDVKPRISDQYESLSETRG
ncbi:hypothetical protein CASFOL_022615 [Castilleja foliolosa]|uniref:Ubiquitin-like protease family profile domain-containing protein n=1 Tax=Castilleja foliolosa TaxID=1961234 RepID=A0ABD3CV20_9LAMI